MRTLKILLLAFAFGAPTLAAPSPAIACKCKKGKPCEKKDCQGKDCDGKNCEAKDCGHEKGKKGHKEAAPEQPSPEK